MNRKRVLDQLGPYQTLYRDDETGIAWVEDGSTGNSHSCHPNIDVSGSVEGMVALGHWKGTDRVRECDGAIYNIDKVVWNKGDPYDEAARASCKCHAAPLSEREAIHV